MGNSTLEDAIKEFISLYHDYKDNEKSGNISLTFNFFKGGTSKGNIGTNKSFK